MKGTEKRDNIFSYALKKSYAIRLNIRHPGVAQLVARYLGAVEAASSSLVCYSAVVHAELTQCSTQTKKDYNFDTVSI